MRSSRLSTLLFALPMAGMLAQTPAPQMNVVYECMAPYSFKFLSCTGTKPTDLCDVQSFNAGRPFQRGKSTYQQVVTLLPKCHLQTPAEAQAAARAAAAPAPNPAANSGGAGPGGFRVGDTVRVLIDGWQEAKVIQVPHEPILTWFICPTELTFQNFGRWKCGGWENSRRRITRRANTISTTACKCW